MYSSGGFAELFETIQKQRKVGCGNMAKYLKFIDVASF
jgi:hypothetical protein